MRLLLGTPSSPLSGVMLLRLLACLIVAVTWVGPCSASFDNPAPGIIAWCNASEPSYVPPTLNRITYAQRGAWACVGPYGNIPQTDNPDYTGCATADAWGTDDAQCVVPGYNFMPTSSQMPDAPRGTATIGYPATINQRDVCNELVYSAPLVDRLGAVYGKVKIFKDYSDMLYVTSSLYALTNYTPHGQVRPAYSGISLFSKAGTPTSATLQALAFLFSSQDQSALINLLNSNT
eukprot:gene20526-27318_t